MAGENNTSVGILIEAQDKATAVLERISGQLGKMGGAMEETGKKSDKMGLSLGSLAKAALGTAAAWKTWDVLRDSVKQFQEAESAMARLATITNNSTGATREMVQELFDQADALERIGVVDSTIITNAQAKLATFDLQTKAIKELTPALLDMAVGEYGVAVTSEQLINMSNGLGKALQGNTEMLVKQGFVITDAQKQMLKYGTEAERVAAINEILGKTYSGLNEMAAETAQGSLLQMQNRLNSIKEELGKALTPTIGLFIDELAGAAGMAEGAAGSFAGLAEVVYRTSNFFLGLGKSVAAGATATLGAAHTAVTALLNPFNKDKVDETSKAWADSLVEITKGANDNYSKWLTGEGFEMPEFNFFGGNALREGLGGALGIDEDEVQKIKEKLEDLGKSYADFAEHADESLFQLRQSHRENLRSINAEMSETRAKMAELRGEFEKGRASDTKTVAQQIVAEEQRIADIEKEMQTDVSASRYLELQAELDKRKTAMAESAAFIQSIEGAVEEARRVAGLTDLERAIEAYTERRAMAEAEFNDNMSKLQSELKALKKQKEEEKELYKEKRNLIVKLADEVAARNALIAAQGLQLTKETITKEIEYYKSLAEAISAARSGNAAEVGRIQKKVTKVNDAIITKTGEVVQTHPDDYIIATKNPGALGGKNISIHIEGAILTQEAARVIGDLILGDLQRQMRGA